MSNALRQTEREDISASSKIIKLRPSEDFFSFLALEVYKSYCLVTESYGNTESTALVSSLVYLQQCI